MEVKVRRFHHRHLKVLTNNTSSNTPPFCYRLEVRSSQTERAVSSGASFLKGLLDTDSIPEISINNQLLKYYEECDKFQEEVVSGPDTWEESRKLEASEAWVEMETNVVLKTGVEMESEMIKLVWNICRYV